MLLPAIKAASPAYQAGQSAYIERKLTGAVPDWRWMAQEDTYADFWAGWETERLDYMEAVHYDIYL